MEPKQQPPPYPLRITPELRKRLETEAEAASRSLNAEIADRLVKSFEPARTSEQEIRAMAVTLANLEHDNAVLTLAAERYLINTALVSHSLREVIEICKALGVPEPLEEEDREEMAEIYKETRAELKRREKSYDVEILHERIADTQEKLKAAKRRLRLSMQKDGEGAGAKSRRARLQKIVEGGDGT